MSVPDRFEHSTAAGNLPRIGFGISFIDPGQGLRAAQVLQKGEQTGQAGRLIVESPVLYESVRPFLETLRGMHPFRMPMTKFLVHGDLQCLNNGIPSYARRENWKWDVSVLLTENADISHCSFDPKSPLSVQMARDTLYRYGKLDPR